jgi:hypothetical protein
VEWLSLSAKCLLIALLGLVMHAVYATAVGVAMGRGSVAYVIPFGEVSANVAGSFAMFEMGLGFLVLIAFAVALIREAE